MLTPGPLLYLLYNLLTKYNIIDAIHLSAKRDALAVIISTYSFTMLGFMAALMAILLSFSQSRAFRRYAQEGRLNFFYVYYVIAITMLCLTFITSLLCYGQQSTAQPAFIFSLIFTVNSLVTMFFVTVIILNLSRRSLKEA